MVNFVMFIVSGIWSLQRAREPRHLPCKNGRCLGMIIGMCVRVVGVVNMNLERVRTGLGKFRNECLCD